MFSAFATAVNVAGKQGLFPSLTPLQLQSEEGASPMGTALAN